MLVMIGALERVIARGMTAHAARMRQQFSDLGKNRARAFCLICDRFKFRWAFEILVDHGPWLGFRKSGRKRGRPRAAYCCRQKNERTDIAPSPQI